MSRIALGVVIAIASTGCALVEDLNGSEYTQVQADAGADGGCGAEGCLTLACASSAECHTPGDVCCITESLLGPATLGCQPASQCTIANFAVQICDPLAIPNECVNGDPCVQSTCTVAGADGGFAAKVNTCSTIPGCN